MGKTQRLAIRGRLPCKRAATGRGNPAAATVNVHMAQQVTLPRRLPWRRLSPWHRPSPSP
eukprot:1207100-Pyramimonas_sp.AAC.1